MKREDERRIWRGVHPLRAWMLMWSSSSSPPKHPKDKARQHQGRHHKTAEKLHNVKRR